jgi:Chromate transporter
VSRAAAKPAARSAPAASGRSLGGLVRYFLGLGAWGFGGPIALVSYMHRDLVEDRSWFTESEYQQSPTSTSCRSRCSTSRTRRVRANIVQGADF